jgi:hypothetical protein
MSKERGEIKELTDAERIRPILEKDPDWPLVSGKQELITMEDYAREKRALTRLTKKATQLLFPEYKALACYGSGTAHYWVHINIVTPENVDRVTERNISERAKKMLLATGLKYGSYYTDYGPNNVYAPCLSINLNDVNWGHY